MTQRTTTIWTFAITSIALFMVSLDNLVVSTAIPVIRTDLDASLEDLSWTVNAYTLTFAVLLLTGAALGDRFGRRRMFAIGVGIFTVASVAAALAPNVEVLNIARAVQGLGGAIVMPLTLTILSAAVPPAKRGLALGAWGAIGGLAIAFGPGRRRRRRRGLLVADTSSGSTSRSGSCSCRSRCCGSRETHGPAGKLDLPGVGLVSAGMFGIVWGLIRGNEQGWTSPEILTAFGLGFALVAAFVAWELRAPAPMLPMSVLPQQGVLAREPRVAVHVLRDVRLDLPADAVLPDRPGLLAARLGAAHPAVDTRTDVRRAVRRRDVRQGRAPSGSSASG